MQKPKGLVERPHFGGLPVPFVTAWINGRPDFKVHDEVARARCGTEELCQFCGLALADVPEPFIGPKPIAFIGSPSSIERRVFGEPPAHTHCLDYAWEVCPWLSAGRGYADTAIASEFRSIDPPETPERMGILVTDRFWMIHDDEGLTQFKYQAGEPTRPIEWRQRG